MALATSIRFETPAFLNEEGQTVVTQVLVSETSDDHLKDSMPEMSQFLQDSKTAYVKPFFIFADIEANEKELAPSITLEEISNEIEFNDFSVKQKITIPNEWLDVLGNRKPDQENRVELEAEFQHYYKTNYRVRRISLIAARTIVNGTVATSAFIAAHIPLSSAMVLGSLTGAMSGGIQLISPRIVDYLSTNKYEIKFKKLLGIKNTSEVKQSKFIFSQLKWFSLEFVFLSILDFTRFSLGILPATGLTHESLSLGVTALKSLISQGAIDTSIAKELSPKMNTLILDKKFAEAAKLRFRSEIFAFTTSMTWAAAAVSDMMGLPLGNFIFGGMGLIGGGNHVRLLMKDKTNRVGSKLKEIFTCSKHFFKKD